MNLKVPSNQHSSLVAKTKAAKAGAVGATVGNQVESEDDERSDDDDFDEDSRDDATDAYTYEDGDSYTCTVNSRDDDGETQFSRQWSTCTDDNSRYTYTTNINKMIYEDDDEDEDNRSMFSAYTDARTLTTVEERDFENFVRTQDMLAASREEAELNTKGNSQAGSDSSLPSAVPTTSRFCANFFDLCGFLGSEIADDVDPQSTKATSEALIDRDEEYDEEDDEESNFEEDEHEIEEPEKDGTIDRDDEESVLDIFEDSDGSNIAPTSAYPCEEVTNKQKDDEEAIGTTTEAEAVPEDKKMTGWRKFRPPMKILPRKNTKRADTNILAEAEEKECKEAKAESIRNASSTSEEQLPEPKLPRKPSQLIQRFKRGGNKSKTETEVNAVGANEKNQSLEEQAPETKLPRKSSKVIQKIKSAGNGSKTALAAAAIGAGAAVAAVAHRTTRTTKTAKTTQNVDDNIVPGDLSIKRNITDGEVALDEIPFTTSTLARGRSVTKERFSQVIEGEESKVKTIKKVRVGTDEHGNDTFAYLVFLSEKPTDVDPDDEMAEEKAATRTSQLIRGKMDESRMELSLARTQSGERMMQDNPNSFTDGDRFILMEVDELPVHEILQLEQNEEVAAQEPAPSKNEPNETETKVDKETSPASLQALAVPCHTNDNAQEEATASSSPLVKGDKTSGSFSLNSNKNNNIMEALSFESVVTQTTDNADTLSKDVVAVVPLMKEASVIPTHIEELVLMEADDEDEIEIELEEEDEYEAVEDRSDMISSIPSDGAVVILEAKGTEESTVAVQESQDQGPHTVRPRKKRISALKKLLKSRKRQN
jgi:hypothetical protein